MSVQAAGITDVPEWRISPAEPSTAGDIVIAGFLGGPYAPARTLVDQEEVPVYVVGRPLERPVSLFSWRMRDELADPQRRITTRTVAGWAG
jgi:arabinosyltransferase A/arabinosyltransferase B/arabinosyltransferase C